MDVLFNPVIISVLVLIVLSLLKIHVIFALILAAISAGLLAGLPLGETVTVLVEGMGGQSETALSYLLLGIFASMIAMSGIVKVLLNYLLRVIGKKEISSYIHICRYRGACRNGCTCTYCVHSYSHTAASDAVQQIEN